MNRTRIAALALSAGVVVVTSWSGAVAGASPSVSLASTSASAAATPAAHGTITIKNYMFSGPGRVLAKGARVTIRNLDSTAHTVTVNMGHAFNVRVGPHKTVVFRAPRKAGRYHYHCSIHPFMTGTIRVR